jgi:hypothetical protein
MIHYGHLLYDDHNVSLFFFRIKLSQAALPEGLASGSSPSGAMITVSFRRFALHNEAGGYLFFLQVNNSWMAFQKYMTRLYHLSHLEEGILASVSIGKIDKNDKNDLIVTIGDLIVSLVLKKS